MGAVSDALRSSAEEFGAEVRTNTPVERILQKDGRVTGVVLAGGEELEADIVVAATHPKITFLEQLGKEELPEEFVGNIERWNSRSGVVKINLALSELPDFSADPGPGGAPRRGRRAGPLHRLHRGGLPGCAARGAGAPAVLRRRHTHGVRPHALPRGVPHNVALYAVGPARMVRGAPQRRTRGLRGPCDRRLQRAGAESQGGPYCTARCSDLTTWSRRSGSSGATSSTASSRPSSSSTCDLPRLRGLQNTHPGLYQASSATHAGGGVCAIPAYNCVREIRRDRRRERLKERLTVRNRG